MIYVPQMEQLTLVSQGILDKLGYSFFSKGGNMSMYDSKNSKVFEAQLTKGDGLYHCDIESVGLCLNSTAVIQSLKEAHNTFGHISEGYLKEIGNFEGKIGECSSCKKAKSTRRAYSKISKTIIPTVGHTIVSDVKVMSNYSLNGNRYILTFVDRKSRLLRVYFLKRKSEVASRTKHFVEWVKTQREKYPKNIHTDGGGEYVNKDLNEFLEAHGINFEYTEAHSPQQNGIAERINRTIIEGSSAMLIQAGLDICFWEQSVKQFVFIKNHTPHKKLRGKRPIDEWNEELGEEEGKGLWSLKPFGCEAEVHIPKVKREKEKGHIKTRKCVYVGMGVDRKTEMFYDYERDKIIHGYCKYYNTQVFPLNPLASREAGGCRCSSNGNGSVSSRKESGSSGRSSSSRSSIEGLSGSISTSTNNSGSTSTSNRGSTSTSSGIDLNGVMPHLEVVEEEVKSTCNKEEEKKNEIEEVEVKNNEIERQYEVEEVIDKRKSRFGKKGGRHKGVDYKVK